MYFVTYFLSHNVFSRKTENRKETYSVCSLQIHEIETDFPPNRYRPKFQLAVMRSLSFIPNSQNPIQ